jgi:pimeloyl-ACP methyl ester carboxylesterase
MSWFEREGTRIYFEEHGDGTPLLFLPGWSESIDEFVDIRLRLAASFRVIAADLPGSGQSGPQPRQYTTTYYRDDASTFLTFLRELKATPAHVAGFSDGGEVALVMAIEDPAAVRSLAVWGAAGALVTPPRLIDAFQDVIDEPIEPLRELSEHLKHAYGEANARVMSQSVASAWRRLAESGGDISRSGAASITCPVLLIAGEHDAFAPPGVVAKLAATLQGADFVELKDAGHVLHREHGPWLADTILGWLGGASS